MRTLNIVLGDQMDRHSCLFQDFDKDKDAIWMAEANGENTQVKHHKHQIVMFLSAMRHFAREQEELGRTVYYHRLTSDGRQDSGKELGHLLEAQLNSELPESVRVVRPGDKRVLKMLESACSAFGLKLEVLEDSHFFTTPNDFAEHAEGRKTLRLEFFYRELRKRFDFLLDSEGEPLGGEWNYDQDNRETFGKDGPAETIEPPRAFQPTDIVAEVQKLVAERYPDHPGTVDNFALPVLPEQAEDLVEDFLENRLKKFGDFQDAMWEGEFFLYHSRLSTALNIKLLHPEPLCRKVEEAYHKGSAPLNAVEGFIRQLLGWREYIRGIYWYSEGDYHQQNFLEHNEPLPEFFWTGKTDMRCLADVLKGVQENAYSHHIQRLMITGLYCLLYGVRPGEFNDWHLATHCDAIDWVSTPNVIGMSQFADGGRLASKPYCASGNYINKMGNYCSNCRYDYKDAVGEAACPFTTLYWDFLRRHQERLKGNNRLRLQLNNLKKKSAEDLARIEETAKSLRS